MYLRLIDTLVKRNEEYNMVEIEMILNYFPHMIWSNEDNLSNLRDAFYYPIVMKIQDNLEKLEKRQFLSVY